MYSEVRGEVTCADVEPSDMTCKLWQGDSALLWYEEAVLAKCIGSVHITDTP